KNEKFCWTPKQVLCDNEKPAPKSNRSPNSCFNYENTNHYLCLFTRVRVGFARTSSACSTSAASNRRYESGCSGTGKSGWRSTAAARAGTASPCDELAAGAAPATAARRTRRCRTTSSCRPTWSARRSDQSRGSRCNKSCCSSCDESCSGCCCTFSGTARWISCRQLVDRQVSQRRSGDVADSDRLNHSSDGCPRAMHLVEWPLVPA